MPAGDGRSLNRIVLKHGGPMPKNIVACSDGTGNSGGRRRGQIPGLDVDARIGRPSSHVPLATLTGELLCQSIADGHL